MNTANQPSGNEDRLAREVLAFSRHESHPEPGVLAAYHSRRLAEGESEAVQDHLAECRHCAELVLDLEELMAGLIEPLPGSSLEPDSRPVSFGQAPVPSGGSESLVPKAPSRRGGLWWTKLSRFRPTFSTLAPAAALLLLGLGLGYGLRAIRVGPVTPRGGAFKVVGVSAPSRTRGMTRGGEAARVSGLLGGVIQLKLPHDLVGDELRLEVVHGDESLLYSQVLRRTAEGELLGLEVPPSLLDPGKYLLRFTVQSAPGARFEYLLEVTP